ncbi:IclR family transcriptional regulator [Peribacillus cavernae]|uniref:IclR family transcriptional regulator n=1 Tax=Peribacillus cavernae TaxID=1674310 RepID=A0A3S0VJW2_9BACI|nr:IclR family transcriptional regulator [Peribacillus cavernae]MDQ0219422.1 IclR family acetate operon transcriptional repressor [Peribacillus cavernae]RUQ27151.1 IclR family transcriptional regulator [Peribacillus cavernae]
MNGIGNSTTVKSAQRVLSTLEILAQNPIGLNFTDLLGELEIPKSSLHQLLNTLVETRMIQFESESKKYILGVRIWEIAMEYTNRLSISQVAQPFIEHLRDTYDETVQMAILDGTDVVYVAKMKSKRPVQLASQVGSRLPAYVTGIGKALLACVSSPQIEKMYPNTNLPSFTDNTITTREELIRVLQATKKRGYARDLGEYSPEIRCVAVPILSFGNVPVAAISFSVLEEQASDEKEAILTRGLLECAESLSLRLGATDPFAWQNI